MHPLLLQAIDAQRGVYRSILEECLLYKSDIWRIENKSDEDPEWMNGFLSAFDAVSLYALIRLHLPRNYIEIGSGHSTRFTRRAVKDGQLDTKLISIDPRPRKDVRGIADRVIEQPVEELSLDIFESLQSGDILFVDDSHRVFTNSDATVVFLDILPRLKPGVLVQFHDIFLPADYPPEWNARYYSEQYLLACHLLAHTQQFEILLANAVISGDPELSSILAELWSHPAMNNVERHGCSFWLRILERRG
ncbi:MAG TPA: class I SAM-dependent methyltransferase [Bryobacteraceae bacterium]|nr:class I SAM-dependent methyltransferase [Bryobacteraceae bacterium]